MGLDPPRFILGENVLIRRDLIDSVKRTSIVDRSEVTEAGDEGGESESPVTSHHDEGNSPKGRELDKGNDEDDGSSDGHDANGLQNAKGGGEGGGADESAEGKEIASLIGHDANGLQSANGGGVGDSSEGDVVDKLVESPDQHVSSSEQQVTDDRETLGTRRGRRIKRPSKFNDFLISSVPSLGINKLKKTQKKVKWIQ